VVLALVIDTLSERWILVIASVCPAGGVQLLLEMKEMVISVCEILAEKKIRNSNKTAYEFIC